MVAIGWGILLLLLVVGLGLDGVALGLLSGLGLSLFVFSGYMFPAAPPYDLMMVQAAWVILTAVLEAVGFFYFLEKKFKFLLFSPWPAVVVACCCLTFITGNRRFFHAAIGNSATMQWYKFPLAIATHMVLLVSPLSLSGLLLFLVVHLSALSILDLLGMVGCITVGIMLISSLLCCCIPYRWLTKCYTWFKIQEEEEPAVMGETNKHKQRFFFLLLLIVCMEGLFLFLKTTTSGFTELTYSGKIFAVKMPLFFALIMLSVAAIVLLCCNLKPAKILLTYRFRLGIQQFFIFLGLSWFIDTLIRNDKGLLLKLLYNILPYGYSSGVTHLYYGLGLILFLYLCLINIQIVIWLFLPLLTAHHLSILHLAVFLVVVHSLAPISYWMSGLVKAPKQKSNLLKKESPLSIKK